MLIELEDINFQKIDITPNTVMMVSVKNASNRNIDKIAEQLRCKFPDNTVLVINKAQMSITTFERVSEK